MPASASRYRPIALPASPLRWQRRYTLTLLFFLSTVICYVDRVNISVAIIPMGREHGYDSAMRGLILSSFFYGYILTQLAGGWMADRFGGKWVLGTGVACWSLATLATPIAAAVSLPALLTIRVLLGLGEGVNFSAIHSMSARWIPAAERARVLAFSYSGLLFGTIVALLGAPPLVIHLGWPAVFYVSGLLGIFWLVFWILKAADGPASNRAPALQEPAAAKLVSRVASVPFDQILRDKAVWALIITHFCNNWGFYIVLLWLPSYLSEALKVPLAHVGEYALIPWTVSFLVGNASGWLADMIRARGVSVTITRKTFQTLAFLLGALPLFAVPHTTNLLATVVLFSLSSTCSGIALAAYTVNHLDIGPQYAGVLKGLSNTAAT